MFVFLIVDHYFWISTWLLVLQVWLQFRRGVYSTGQAMVVCIRWRSSLADHRYSTGCGAVIILAEGIPVSAAWGGKGPEMPTSTISAVLVLILTLELAVQLFDTRVQLLKTLIQMEVQTGWHLCKAVTHYQDLCGIPSQSLPLGVIKWLC